METGATALAFADEVAMANQANRGDRKAAGAEVAFVVEDVPAAFARAIESGAAAVTEPVDKPWGQTISCVTSTGSLSRSARPSTPDRMSSRKPHGKHTVSREARD